MVAEVRLEPGWLMRDVERAAAKVKEWEANKGARPVTLVTTQGKQKPLPASES